MDGDGAEREIEFEAKGFGSSRARFGEELDKLRHLRRFPHCGTGALVAESGQGEAAPSAELGLAEVTAVEGVEDLAPLSRSSGAAHAAPSRQSRRVVDGPYRALTVFRDVGIPDALLLQAIQIMDAGRLLSLSTRQFRPAGEDFNRWPFPVAVTRHKIEQTTNSLFKLNLLFDHFDCLIRYFYLTREVLEGRTPQLVEHPSLGWWVDRLAHSLKGGSLFREVVRIAEQEKVVFLRNNLKGHGFTILDPKEYEKEVATLEDIMGRIENELIPFFAGHRLLIPRATKLKDGVYIVEGFELKGSHLLHPPFQAKLRNDPLSAGLTSTEVEDVFVSDSSLQCFHRFSPYIRSAFCPKCQHSRILMTDGGNKFIDIFMGHRVTISPNELENTGDL